MKQSKLWFLLFLAACITIVVSGASRLLNPESNDFEAFFEAANHLINGHTPYLPNVERPYKYPPVATLLMTPLAFFEGSVSRRLFVCADVLATFANILLCWKLFFGSWRPKADTEKKLFFQANAIAIFTSLRFLDNEYHSKNMNQISYMLILWGLLCVRQFRYPLWGLLLSGWGCFVKLTPLMSFWTYVGLPFKKRLSTVMLALFILLFVPWPTMWIDWAKQMLATTGAFPLQETPLFFQGFFPFSARYLGAESRSLSAVAFALPLILFTLWKIPRFRVSTLFGASSKTWQRFLMSQFLLIFLSLTLNPLPWQHLYGFLLILIAASCYMRRSSPPPLTSLCCALIALSSRGVSGKGISDFFESSQILFLCFLLIFADNLRALIQSVPAKTSSVDDT